MSAGDWRPLAALDAIVLRAEMYRAIREFFAARDVLEVETPLLGSTTANEPHLASFEVLDQQAYLQTSPEFAMKRLLAAGSGPIFQICKAFRQGESGAKHNPEFSMLEWYRPGFELHQLMAEVEDLCRLFVGNCGTEHLSYKQVFSQALGINPHTADIEALRELAQLHADYDETCDDIDILLDLLMSHVVEPRLGRGVLTFICDYPASQAALAQVEPDGEGIPVARRFELYFRGMELANGYKELTDPVEQRARFVKNQGLRRAAGAADYPVDERLLAALPSLPDCCGVALGLDRLVMLQAGVSSISEVLAFPVDRA